MIRRLGGLWLIALVLAVLAGAGSARAATSSTAPPAVVVVGVPGLQWSQVDAARTPVLWRLYRSGAAGDLSIRSADALTCTGDGWLTIGAGNRVRTGAPCNASPPPWPRVVAANRSLDFDAVPGILASALAAHGDDCVAAVGTDATLGARDRDGTVSATYPVVSRPALTHCPVTLVSAPAAADPGGAAAADRVIGAADAARPAGSVLLVVGLADLDPHSRAHLHVALALGGPFGSGALVSPSTRRAPYVQLIDVAATVLQLRGAAHADGVAAAVDGQPWRSVGTAPPDLRSLVDDDVAAGAVARAVVPVMVLAIAVPVLGVALLLLSWRRRSPRLRSVAGAVLLAGLAAPAATYLANLAPWWRTGHPSWTALAAVAAWTCLLGLVGVLVARRWSAITAAGAIALLTAAVLCLDVISGSRLQLDSVMGYSPLVAGRFIGIGNVTFGVLAAAAVLGATAVALLRRRWLLVVAIGIVVVVVDGAPPWGSDVGGVLSLVPGFAVLALLVSGRRVGWRRLLVIGCAAVAVVTVFALADYARPADAQTHLGRFVGKVLHGGAGTVLARKAHADVSLLFTNAATLSVPLLVALALWLVLRPGPRLAAAFASRPVLRYGLTALALTSLVGLVVNDSGISIPALAVLLAVPYVAIVLLGDTPDDTQTSLRGPAGRGSDVLP